MLAGLLLAFSEMLVRLFSGKDVVDAIWPHAVRSLEWTMTLRSSPILTLTLFVGAGLAGYGLRTAVSKAKVNVHGCFFRTAVWDFFSAFSAFIS